MKISRENLMTIGGLEVSGVLDSMDDRQYDMYCNMLSDFVETFPECEASLKKMLIANEYINFSSLISSLREVLTKIYATDLDQSCQRLLDELGCQKHTIVEAHLTYLLAEISALSIDIQMAQRESEISATSPVKTAFARKMPENTSRQKTILAVDDVSLLLLSLKTILQNTEYKFVGVNSGEAALRYIDKHTPDLFILDIEMPGMNGYDLTKQLRQRGQTAPIIFLTGNASAGYVLKAIEVGAADFIVKPVNKERVLEKISRHIQ